MFRSDSMSIFKDPVSQTQRCTCCVCLKIPHPDNAVCHGECGSIFCQPCLSNVLKQNHLCPVCRRAMDRVPDLIKVSSHFIYVYMCEMTVSCPMKELGCAWQGDRLSLDEHLQRCLYKDVKCPFGCGAVMSNADFYAHLTKCTHCPIICMNEPAPVTMISCPFSIVSCGWKGPADALEKHIRESERMHKQVNMTLKELETAKRMIGQLERQIAEMIKAKKSSGNKQTQECSKVRLGGVIMGSAHQVKPNGPKRVIDREWDTPDEDAKDGNSDLNVSAGEAKPVPLFVGKTSEEDDEWAVAGEKEKPPAGGDESELGNDKFDGELMQRKECPKGHIMTKIKPGNNAIKCSFCGRKNTFYESGGSVCYKCDYYICPGCRFIP